MLTCISDFGHVNDYMQCNDTVQSLVLFQLSKGVEAQGRCSRQRSIVTRALKSGNGDDGSRVRTCSPMFLGNVGDYRLADDCNVRLLRRCLKHRTGDTRGGTGRRLSQAQFDEYDDSQLSQRIAGVCKLSFAVAGATLPRVTLRIKLWKSCLILYGPANRMPFSNDY